RTRFIRHLNHSFLLFLPLFATGFCQCPPRATWRRRLCGAWGGRLLGRLAVNMLSPIAPPPDHSIWPECEHHSVADHKGFTPSLVAFGCDGPPFGEYISWSPPPAECLKLRLCQPLLPPLLFSPPLRRPLRAVSAGRLWAIVRAVNPA